MPYDLLGAEDILAGLDVLGEGAGTMLAGYNPYGQIVAGAQPPHVQAAVKQALAAQHAQKAMAVKAATRDLAMRHAQAVVPRDYTRGRVLVQGIGTTPQDAFSLTGPGPFGPTVVAPGQQKTFTAQPQIPFKPDRFFVSDDLSANEFLITDIKVGQQSMLSASNPLPASMFAESTVDSVVNFDTAQISQQLIVGVINIGGATKAFLAGFRGYAAL